MVVPVLMTSCQVSENPKTGPEMAQTMMTPKASMNAHELPVARETALAASPNHFCMSALLQISSGEQ
jgi:hypothetical protein